MSGDPPPAGGGRSTEALLGDLADATRVARSVVARGRAAYDADEALRYAAQMVLVRLREVATRLDPADAVAAAPGFDWRGLARMRNLVVHRYPSVDDELVWAALEGPVAELGRALDRRFGGR